MTTFYDMKGNSWEYNEENGLIAKNGAIVSGALHEPVFAKSLDDAFPPICVGIYLKGEDKVVLKSGNIRGLVNSKSL